MRLFFGFIALAVCFCALLFVPPSCVCGDWWFVGVYSGYLTLPFAATTSAQLATDFRRCFGAGAEREGRAGVESGWVRGQD